MSARFERTSLGETEVKRIPRENRQENFPGEKTCLHGTLVVPDDTDPPIKTLTIFLEGSNLARLSPNRVIGVKKVMLGGKKWNLLFNL